MDKINQIFQNMPYIISQPIIFEIEDEQKSQKFSSSKNSCKSITYQSENTIQSQLIQSQFKNNIIQKLDQQKLDFINNQLIQIELNSNRKNKNKDHYIVEESINESIIDKQKQDSFQIQDIQFEDYADQIQQSEIIQPTSILSELQSQNNLVQGQKFFSKPQKSKPLKKFKDTKDRIELTQKIDDQDKELNKEASSLEKMKQRFKNYKNTYK